MNERLGTRYLILLGTVVFLGFSTIGIPLAVLPNLVHDILGFGAFIVGVVIGVQSLATVMTRQIAGASADLLGANQPFKKVCSPALPQAPSTWSLHFF